MNTLTVAVFCLAIAVASCSPVWPAPAFYSVDGGALVKGPVVASTAVGPDGSSVSSVADSGAVGVAPRAAGLVASVVPAVAPAPWAAPAVVAW